ncbi:MAG: hypothetical protein U0821_19580 [Chloroflexota bacterium]
MSEHRRAPRRFDVAGRVLIAAHPENWLQLVGLPADGPAIAIDSNVSTVLAEVDQVVRVEGAKPWIAHIETQSGRDLTLSSRLLRYHALLLHAHQLPVATSVVLLRPEADGAELTGTYRTALPDGGPGLVFPYRVVRVWQLDVEVVLAGGLGTLPLAPISQVAEAEVPRVVQRVAARIRDEANASTGRDLWAATYLLLGLRFGAEQARALLAGGMAMRESATYQAILKEGRSEGLRTGRQVGRREGRQEGQLEGRADEARRWLLRLGSRRFGPPAGSVSAAIERITSVERLEQLGERLLTAESWDDLLAD